MAEPGKVDLHLHSTESDGRLSPSALVELAFRNGVRRLALTDHDATAGLPAAREAGRRLGVEVFAGVELSADVGKNELHLLGLFVDEANPELQRELARFREGRIGRAKKMVATLAELGVPVSWERVQEIAGIATIGRPHVAQALLEAGHVTSMPEAFDRYLGNGKPAYFTREKLPPGEAIDLIRRAGGLAVAAHPLDSDRVADLIAELARVGLDGVESYYQGYTPEQVMFLVDLARQHGLTPTGGSDYHGFPMSGMTEATNEPGSVPIPPEVVDELLARRRERLG